MAETVSRILVKIELDETQHYRRRYTPQLSEELRTKILSHGKNKTEWLCGACIAYSYWASLYVFVDTTCTAHAHVLGQEAKA